MFGQFSAHIVLRNMRDNDGTRLLEASRTSDGDILIEGLDRGDGVERVFGEREYEWKRKIRACDVDAFMREMGATGDVLAAMKARFSDEKAGDLDRFLETHGIPFEAWSRVGD